MFYLLIWIGEIDDVYSVKIYQTTYNLCTFLYVCYTSTKLTLTEVTLHNPQTEDYYLTVLSLI